MERRDKKKPDRPPFSKARLRRRFADLRNGRSASSLAETGLRAAENLLHSRFFRDAKKVALYHPIGKEVSPLPIFRDLTACGKRAFFPKVCGESLRFFEVSSESELSPGAFSVPEPALSPDREIAPSALDLMVVPGICFDRRGSRIGYGKGFYDRAMKGVAPEKICALAYSFQIADFEIPAAPHDGRVGFIACERGVFRAQNQKGR